MPIGRSRGSLSDWLGLSTLRSKVIRNSEFISIYFDFLKRTNVSRSLILYAGILITIASAFQMLGLGLVVPVLNALVDQGGFEAIITAPILGEIIKILPFENSNQNVFIFMIVLIFIAVILENLFLFLGRYYALMVDKNLTSKLRIILFDKYIKFHKGFFATKQAAEINTVLTHFIPAASRTNNNICQLFTQTVFSIIFVILMAIISWRLTLLSLLLLPIIHIFANSISNTMKTFAIQAHNAMIKLTNQVDDVFNNISLVQLAANEKNEARLFHKNANDVSKYMASARIRGYLVPAIVDILNAAGALIIVVASIFLFFTFNSYSLGRLLVFFVALRRFIGNAQQFSSNWVQSVAETPGLEIIKQSLNAVDNLEVISGELNFKTPQKAITFQNISFSYNDSQLILKSINLGVPVNSITAIVGPSGSGKTTLINLLPRFYDPVRGEILIDETDIKNFKLDQLRKNIGIVSQRAMLLNCSIKENITYGLENIQNIDYQNALRNAQLVELIDSLPKGDNTLVGNRGEMLSGGEMQRLSIAHALLCDPKILILDEPSSALDAATEQKLDLALQSVMKDRTVFIIAHRLITVKKADQIVFLEGGEIKESGSFDELIKKQGRFYQYSQLQNL